MLFQFKTKPEDFIVKEKLWFIPGREGNFFYVLWEKENKNTMDIVNSLCKKFWLKRNDIGIAGLKDKQAITEQWISIEKKTLSKLWWTAAREREFNTHGQIIATGRYSKQLGVGMHEGNHFAIRLRAQRAFSTHEDKELMKKLINETIEETKKDWFPNCFGQQRFGSGDRNFKRALEILDHTNPSMDDFEIKFKLQAYASMYFNDYTLTRREKKKFIQEWDIMIDKYHGFWVKTGIFQNNKIQLFNYKICKEEHREEDYFFPDHFQEIVPYSSHTWLPTGPILGRNLLLPPKGSKAYRDDWKLLGKTKFLKNANKVSKLYTIFGVRRPLRVHPQNLIYKRENDDLIISFGLPTGSYATVLLWWIFKSIDYKTCLENKLLIPNTLKW